MRTPFTYSYERFSGLLEDRLTGTLYADNKRDAFLMLVANLRDFPAATESEAMAKAEVYLAGTDKSVLEIWDQAEITCYRDLDVQEELVPAHAR